MVPQCQRPTTGPAFFPSVPRRLRARELHPCSPHLRLPASMATITSLRLRRGAFKRPHLLAHQEVPLAFLPPVILFYTKAQHFTLCTSAPFT